MTKLSFNIKCNRAIKERKKMVKKYTKLYPDWKDDEYNCGPHKFIFGVKTGFIETSAPASFATLNDLEISFNRSDSTYYLGIDVIPCVASKLDDDSKELKGAIIDADFFQALLAPFTAFMLEQGYTQEDLDAHFDFVVRCVEDRPYNLFESHDLLRLYINFKTFVYGMIHQEEVTKARQAAQAAAEEEAKKQAELEAAKAAAKKATKKTSAKSKTAKADKQPEPAATTEPESAPVAEAPADPDPAPVKKTTTRRKKSAQ